MPFLPRLLLWLSIATVPSASLAPGAAPGAPAQVVLGGRVTDDSTGAPLHGAQVYLTELGAGSLTDAEGRYAFSVSTERLPDHRVVLVAQLIGYGSVEVTLAVPSAFRADSLRVDLDLRRQPIPSSCDLVIRPAAVRGGPRERGADRGGAAADRRFRAPSPAPWPVNCNLMEGTAPDGPPGNRGRRCATYPNRARPLALRPEEARMMHVQEGQCGLCSHFGEHHPSIQALIQIRRTHEAPEDFVDDCGHPRHAALHLHVSPIAGCDAFEPAKIQA